VLLVVFGGQAIADAQGAREVEIHAEKVGEVVHWMPEAVEVVQGETVVFVLNHKLEGGFEFHGIAIDALQIKDKVYRHKTLKIERQIPLTLKPGEYVIGCQFHPKHAPAKLIVRPKAS
jgi:plastocyanin